MGESVVKLDGVFLDIVRNSLNLEEDAPVESGTELAGMDGWDSLGKFMFLSSALSDYGVTIDAPDVNDAKTVGDLWALIERAKG